jgi:protein-S-isoprenylcysteine O-methyltransferase Ste14
VRRPPAALGSIAFFVVAPGCVAGLLPWWLTGWRSGEPFAHYWPLRLVGAALVAAGAGVLVHAFVRFVVDGLGTPAPVAPPEHLVVTGLYRHNRNPMYVAVVAAVLGQALALGRPVLLAYALLAWAVMAWAVMASFVRWYEEPALRRRFGAHYGEYRRAVPAWGVRLRPWTRPDGG